MGAIHGRASLLKKCGAVLFDLRLLFLWNSGSSDRNFPSNFRSYSALLHSTETCRRAESCGVSVGVRRGSAGAGLRLTRHLVTLLTAAVGRTAHSRPERSPSAVRPSPQCSGGRPAELRGPPHASESRGRVLQRRAVSSPFTPSSRGPRRSPAVRRRLACLLWRAAGCSSLDIVMSV